MSVSLITITQSPGTFSAIANDMYFVFASSDYSKRNFQYTIDVNTLSPSTVTKNTIDVGPRPQNGYGYFSPNGILNSLIDNNYPFYSGILPSPTFSSNLICSDTKTYTRYYLGYGYTFDPNLTFTTLQTGTVVSLSVGAHDFSVGDTIYLSTYNSYLSGTATVTKTNYTIPNKIDINKAWSSDAANTTGTITYAKHFTGTSSTKYAVSMGIDYGQDNDRNFVDNNYIISGTTSDVFLTKFTNYTHSNAKLVLLDNYETVSFLTPTTFNSPVSLGDSYVFVNTYDTSMSLIATYSYAITDIETSYNKFVLGVGPMNLKNKNVGMTGVGYYSVQFGVRPVPVPLPPPTPAPSTGPISWFKIDTQCSPFNNVRLVWMNRLGGYDYFNFTLNSQRSERISRKEFKQVLRPYYNTGERGTNLIKVDVETMYTINSNWVTEDEYLALNDLLDSLGVYVVGDDNKLYPIIIDDDSYTQKTYLTDKLFNMSLTYKTAYDKNIQTN